MSIISGVGAGLGGAGDSGGALGSFYSTTLDNSLRLNAADSAHLTFAQGTATDIAKWTVNFWLKRTEPLEASDDYDTVFGVDGPGNTAFTFLSGKIYFFANYNTGGGQISLISNRVFRDPSAWYNFHITFDRANSTAAYRVRIYVNGVEETDWATDQRSTIASDSSTGWNVSGYTAAINRRSGGVDSRYHNGYLAQFYNIDGAVVAPTEFAETKDGVWVPKAYSGSYGNNGWLLEFKQTGTGTGAANTVGADTSGNNNHWTSSGISAHDVVPDRPTNNFSTMNPLFDGNSAVLSDGNLKIATGGFTSSKYGVISTFAIPKDKKIYVEVECTDATGDTWTSGFATKTSLEGGPGSSNVGDSGAIMVYNRQVEVNDEQRQYTSSDGLGGTGVARLAAGDILGMMIDGATGKVWFSRNGTYFKAISGNNTTAGNVGNPNTDADEIGTITGGTTDDVFVVVSGNTTPDNIFVNFGQDSQNVASANADANGIGTFEYAPPTDYVALCASNLTAPAIGPTQSSQATDHFDTVLFNGTGANQTVTGFNFQPDFVWNKTRNQARHHTINDSVRGGAHLKPSNTDGEGASTISAYNSDGYDWTYNSSNVWYDSSATVVSWAWLAGGSTSSISADSISSGVPTLASTVSVNATAGFSIVTYTGNLGSSGTASVGHGLGVRPNLIISKSRDASGGDAGNWAIWHNSLTTDNYILRFDTEKESNKSGNGNMASLFTTNTFGTNYTTGSNVTGNTYVAYVFAEIEGYSKFGSYIGNSAADGTFVFTGFRPAFVILKKSSGSGDNWSMYDNKRDTDNVVREYIIPNDPQTAGATDTMDFFSNGFKVRNAGAYINGSNATYIYWAFAEQPFKFANAR